MMKFFSNLSVRAFSSNHAKQLANLCRLPRIQELMQKEALSIKDIKPNDPDSRLYYIKKIQESDKLFNALQKGFVTLKDYVSTEKKNQDNILFFLEYYKNHEEILVKKHIDLLTESHFFRVYRGDNLFHNDLLNFLEKNNSSIKQFLAQDDVKRLHQLSNALRLPNIRSFLTVKPSDSPNKISHHQLLTMTDTALEDLIELLSDRCWDIDVWLQENYLSIQQFLDCTSHDRKKYMSFMYNKKVPCEQFFLTTFLSLKPSTKEHICFHQMYINPQEFDTLNATLQESIRLILFSIMGIYALNKNFISVKQFMNLSANAQSAFSVLFYNADEIYWEAEKVREKINRLFEQGFDFEEFNHMAKKSQNDAHQYLHDHSKKHKTSHHLSP